jgi:FAD dependent oxidoreductase TIGR03364
VLRDTLKAGMTRTLKVDLAIVGAGIVGLAHAYLAARSGLRVALFERNPAAMGASVRNFGMIWPIGQTPGEVHRLALRSRELWLQVLHDLNLPYFETGSLHAAYREDEAAVGQEFSERAPSLGYECAWLDPSETLTRTQALRKEGLVGALWSPTEMAVDARRVVHELPRFLNAQFGVEFHFNTAVQRVESGVLYTAELRCEAASIVIAAGDDFQTLFPECFRDSSLTRCKLQMMRTVPQPEGWRLGPSLAFGLTFRHYPAFQICTALQALKERVATETPEYDRFGIHVMVSQAADGELIIGDSHEYGLAVNIFDNAHIRRLILDYAKTYLRTPALEIAEEWHGVYAKHPTHPWLRLAPVDGVRLVTFTTGTGMTMSFGLAEQTFLEMGISV